MTYQRPVFTGGGLFGKANRFVCNAWTDGAESVAEHAEGIRWSQQQVVRGSIPERWLAKITAATALAANRWHYTFVAAEITALRYGSVLNGTFGQGAGAVNIREMTNNATTVDGSRIPTGATIGPVGSVYVAGTGWPITPLEAYVEMRLDYDASGGVLYWFDAPNPSECGT